MRHSPVITASCVHRKCSYFCLQWTGSVSYLWAVVAILHMSYRHPTCIPTVTFCGRERCCSFSCRHLCVSDCCRQVQGCGQRSLKAWFDSASSFFFFTPLHLCQFRDSWAQSLQILVFAPTCSPDFQGSANEKQMLVWEKIVVLVSNFAVRCKYTVFRQPWRPA